MFGIFDKIEEFFKELLLGGIQANLESMFLDINNQVGKVASDIGQTPEPYPYHYPARNGSNSGNDRQ